jgi:hypothetical protein
MDSVLQHEQSQEGKNPQNINANKVDFPRWKALWHWGTRTLTLSTRRMMVYSSHWDIADIDILARLTMSLFPNPSKELTPLLHQTFTPTLLSQTTCVILLDWSTPWRWLRDLRDWISVVMGFLHESTRTGDKAAEYERVVSEIISKCISPPFLSLIDQANRVFVGTRRNLRYSLLLERRPCYR